MDINYLVKSIRIHRFQFGYFVVIKLRRLKLASPWRKSRTAVDLVELVEWMRHTNEWVSDMVVCFVTIIISMAILYSPLQIHSHNKFSNLYSQAVDGGGPQSQVIHRVPLPVGFSRRLSRCCWYEADSDNGNTLKGTPWTERTVRQVFLLLTGRAYVFLLPPPPPPATSGLLRPSWSVYKNSVLTINFSLLWPFLPWASQVGT